MKLKLVIMALLSLMAAGCSKTEAHTVPENTSSGGGVGPFDMQISDSSAERINKFSVAVNQDAGKVEFNYTPSANVRLQFQGATTAVTGCDSTSVKVTHLWFVGASGTTLTKILQRNDVIDTAANTKYTLVVAYENIKGCTNISYEMRMKKVETAPTIVPTPLSPFTTCDKLNGRFAVNMTSIDVRQTQCSKITFNYEIHDFSGGAGDYWAQDFVTDGIERSLTVNDGVRRESGLFKAYYNPSSTPANRLEVEYRSPATPTDTLRKEYYLNYPSPGMACLTYDSFLNGVPQKVKYHLACGNGTP